MGTVFPLPALARLAFDYYFATDLIMTEADPDPAEILEVVWMNFDEVLDGVMNGDLQHGSLPHAVMLAMYKGLMKPRGTVD